MQSSSQRDPFYEDLLRPLLFQMDAEEAHNLVHQLLHRFGGVLSSLPYRYEGADLRTRIGNLDVSNPFGLAAGFDKNAQLVSVLGHLGFGYAEVGSVTARPSNGNARPRMFRLPQDKALINRLGLNGEGADLVSARLRRSSLSLPVGINIAKTHDPSIAGDAAIEDILYSFKTIRDINPGYVALNASCPNTREGCMQEKQLLSDVLSEMQKMNTAKLPLLVKVSPDSSEQLLSDIVEVSSANDIHGYVCGNTTLKRDALRTPQTRLDEIGVGGLSGPPLTTLSLELTKRLARMKGAEQVIIGVGGISSGADAYAFIRNGANALQIYTALVYAGPSLIKRLCEELSDLLKRDGLSLKQATGAEVKP